MTVEQKLGVLTKIELGSFAAQMAIKHPEQRAAILSLQDTLEQRLPPAVQNQIIEKLNRDTSGTLDKARALIDKDPKILDAINKDPMKLAQIMGVSTPAAPAATAQAAAPAQPATPAASPAQVGAAPAVAKVEADKPSRPAPAAVAAAPVAPATPLSATEMADRQSINEAADRIKGMEGFKEFAGRAQKSQSMSEALDAMMGEKHTSSAERLKSLREIESDPKFFMKANQAIEQIPPQMRDNVFSQIAENPALGKQALAGDGGAKMQLMLGGMFGGGGKGLSGLFGGPEGGGIMQMLGNLLPKLLEGLKQALGPIMNGIGKMMGSSGLMGGMGNGQGQVINNTAKTIDQTMGSNIQDKPYVDASRPDQPATTLAQKAAEPAPDARPGAAEPVVGMVDQRRLPGTQAPNTAFV